MHDFQNIITSVVSYVQSWLKYQTKALNQLSVNVSKLNPFLKVILIGCCYKRMWQECLEQPIPFKWREVHCLLYQIFQTGCSIVVVVVVVVVV